MYTVKFHNKKIEINDQELANAIIEEFRVESKRNFKHKITTREAKDVVYFAHI